MQPNVTVDVLVLQQPISPTLGAARDWVDTTRNAAGRVENADFKVVERWKQQSVIVTHVWYFIVDPQVKDLENAFLFNGYRYEVRNVENVQNMNRLWEVVTEKIRNQPA